MEQKSIGSFIAVLRKANGMTQRELAEKLNVSDKAVSRWERDECAPDLTLIPVLAEIFGITSDELLRGERATQRQTEEAQANKTKKQLDRLLQANATKLKIRSIISGGIALAGLFAAMICNSAFLRASLGFFAGCVFYAAAAVCEACFGVAAFSAVTGTEFDEEKLAEHKTKLKKIIAVACAVVAVMFTATLPLLLGSTYTGIDEGDWFLYALVCVAVLAAAAVFVLWVARLVLAKKGRIKLQEIKIKKDKLKIKTAVITAAAIAATALAHAVFLANVSPVNFAEGTMHYSVASFKSLIETPVEYENYNYHVYEEMQTQTAVEPLPEDEYYTDYAEEWEEILKQNEITVYSLDGEELFRYSHLNSNIKEVRLGDGENRLPITTYSYEQLWQGEVVINWFNLGFAALYAAEAVTGVVCYFKKRKKI